MGRQVCGQIFATNNGACMLYVLEGGVGLALGPYTRSAPGYVTASMVIDTHKLSLQRMC